jgi:uncharacterized protein
MNKIAKTEKWVQAKLAHDTTGHDWQHIDRVRRNAVLLYKKEGGNREVIELAALLHDVVDDKLVEDVEKAYEEVWEWLKSQQVEEENCKHIVHILQTMSFKGGNRPAMATLEGQIVQDADRLDAIGAIGIARTFMYAGAKGTPLYDENIAVRSEMTEEEYRHGKSTAIAHFYEKLLKLTALMNTQTARSLAQERHTYMKEFLVQFKKEWNYHYENADC